MNPGRPPRILIVDDEAPARSRLRDLLEDCRGNFPFVIAGEAANGLEALECLADRAPVDIMLTDIRMPQMDGIELAQHAQKLENPPAIIFTTAFDAYAIQAFELNAVDYLLKPIRAARLEAALRKASVRRPLTEAALKALGPRSRTHLSVAERGRVLLVPVPEIRYLRAEQKYITIKTVAREYLLEESLISLEQEFGERFVRIHRNCLVARAAIGGFERITPAEGEPYWVVVLNDLPEKLPVSRRQQHVVRQF